MNATTPREPGHRLNFRKDDSRSGVLGASLVWMAMILAALGAITTYALPMITATDQTVIAGNQLLRANYLAEAGFRYAASLYLNTENEALGGDENSADDEKASLLKTCSTVRGLYCPAEWAPSGLTSFLTGSPSPAIRTAGR